MRRKTFWRTKDSTGTVEVHKGITGMEHDGSANSFIVVFLPTDIPNSNVVNQYKKKSI